MSSSWSCVTINGVKYTGSNVSITPDGVFCDGVKSKTLLIGKVEVKIEGSLEDLTVHGDVTIQGNVGGDVHAANVTCQDIRGDVSAAQVECRVIEGDVSAAQVRMRR